ncbi:hypothetical protein Goarm_002137 [Gossypium armourianum]|uniref:Uncharacterized protein n=1 Tax=Gossypium armourianum TaxID=34283 RepID=A0A7J9K786_9ROSI|nr:hypothetical protein [Gossypium armourianum]
MQCKYKNELTGTMEMCKCTHSQQVIK